MIREVLGIMRDVLRSLRPWLLLAAVGVAYGFVLAVVLLPLPFF